MNRVGFYVRGNELGLIRIEEFLYQADNLVVNGNQKYNGAIQWGQYGVSPGNKLDFVSVLGIVGRLISV